MPQATVALIMAGGLGTRMAAAQPVVPKPLVEVGGRSLIEIALRQGLRAGIRDVRLALRHQADRIAAHVRGLRGLPPYELGILLEDEPLGTIGALFDLKGVDRTVLVTNGDLLS